MSKIKRENKIDDFIEKWYPSDKDKQAFADFLNPFLEIKEASVVNVLGKNFNVPRHYGYKDEKFGQNYAMRKFGAIKIYKGKNTATDEEYQTIAVCADVFENEFIKGGFDKNLFNKFRILERSYLKDLSKYAQEQ